ncbi:MAG: UbiD family decarboxylase, partial [Betaproteobacteria bacterium]|nr:UbiD family decarboxylase [Betaproteobacteria bacterium]
MNAEEQAGLDTSFRSALARMLRAGRIRVFEREADPYLDVAGMMNQLDGGPSLLFPRVKGYDMPVIGNVPSCRENCEAAFGMDYRGIRQVVGRALGNPVPPRLVDKAPVHERIYRDDFDLGRVLPVLTHTEADSGRFITGGIVIVKDPETGVYNASYHRLQLIGPKRTAIKLDFGRHLRAAYERAQRLGQPLPIAACIGTDIAVYYTAATMGSQMPESADELRVLAKVLVWLQETESGDRSEINLNGPGERAVWNRISAADENCGGETCVRRMGGVCPFYRAHQAAQAAHILVVNHALLLADVATGSRVLPDYDRLIVDEGHHMEAATTSALSYRLTQPEVERLLRELGGSRSGLLGRLLAVSQGALQPGQYGSLITLVEDATTKAIQFQNQLTVVFTSISQFLTDQREGRPVGDYSHQERIVDSTRAQPAWVMVEVAWDTALQLLNP